MLSNYAIERIINTMVKEYAPDAQGYCKDKAIFMMYNTVQRAHCQDYAQVEDIVRGMCHIFADGITMGMIIQEKG